jgi:hypothetical protein
MASTTRQLTSFLGREHGVPSQSRAFLRRCGQRGLLLMGFKKIWHVSSIETYHEKTANTYTFRQRAKSVPLAV